MCDRLGKKNHQWCIDSASSLPPTLVDQLVEEFVKIHQTSPSWRDYAESPHWDQWLRAKLAEHYRTSNYLYCRVPECQQNELQARIWYNVPLLAPIPKDQFLPPLEVPLRALAACFPSRGQLATYLELLLDALLIKAASRAQWPTQWSTLGFPRVKKSVFEEQFRQWIRVHGVSSEHEADDIVHVTLDLLRCCGFATACENNDLAPPLENHTHILLFHPDEDTFERLMAKLDVHVVDLRAEVDLLKGNDPLILARSYDETFEGSWDRLQRLADLDTRVLGRDDIRKCFEFAVQARARIFDAMGFELAGAGMREWRMEDGLLLAQSSCPGASQISTGLFGGVCGVPRLKRTVGVMQGRPVDLTVYFSSRVLADPSDPEGSDVATLLISEFHRLYYFDPNARIPSMSDLVAAKSAQSPENSSVMTSDSSGNVSTTPQIAEADLDPDPGVCGLENNGVNVCGMNSVFQTIFWIKPLRDLVLGWHSKDVSNIESEPLFEAMEAVRLLFARMLLDKRRGPRVVNGTDAADKFMRWHQERRPVPNYGASSGRSDDFAIGRQLDVDELFRAFVTMLEEALVPTESHVIHPVVDLFKGSYQRGEAAPENFYGLLMSMRRSNGQQINGLLSALDWFTANLPGGEHDDLVSFTHMPPVVSFTLQRTDNLSQKNLDFFDFPFRFNAHRYHSVFKEQAQFCRDEIARLNQEVTECRAKLELHESHLEVAQQQQMRARGSISQSGNFSIFESGGISASGSGGMSRSGSQVKARVDVVRALDVAAAYIRSQSMEAGEIDGQARAVLEYLEHAANKAHAASSELTTRMAIAEDEIAHVFDEIEAITQSETGVSLKRCDSIPAFRSDPATLRYSLHSVIVHSGSPVVGHYTVYVRDPDVEEEDIGSLPAFLHFDDTNVTRVPFETVLRYSRGGADAPVIQGFYGGTPTAYVLVYTSNQAMQPRECHVPASQAIENSRQLFRTCHPILAAQIERENEQTKRRAEDAAPGEPATKKARGDPNDTDLYVRTLLNILRGLGYERGSGY